ncbi:MAG: response regulator [Nitrospirota bacterium]
MHSKQATSTICSPPRVGTILLVEDHKTLRDLTRNALLKLGYTVLFAADSDSAIKVSQMHRDPIDLLIADVVLPGMNGSRLAERLRTLRPDMRVLFMSGMVPEGSVRIAAISGSGFLQKPFGPDVLAAKVREMLADTCS